MASGHVLESVKPLAPASTAAEHMPTGSAMSGGNFTNMGLGPSTRLICSISSPKADGPH